MKNLIIAKPVIRWIKISVISFCLLFLFLLLYPIGYFVLDAKQQVQSHSSGPYKGVGAYVINLDRSKERYEHIKPYVDGLGLPVERISGVDGKLLSEAEIKQKVDFQAYENIIVKKGVVGCSLSHIKAWQTFLDSNFEYAIIFEDDANFDPKKLRSVIDELVDNNHYWDINAFEVGRRPSMPLIIKPLQHNQNLVVYLGKIRNAVAYMINRKAAVKLLERALPIKMPVDNYFTRGWELDLKFTGLESPGLFHSTRENSEILAIGLNGSIKPERTIVSTIGKYVYSPQTKIMRIFYNLKCYVESKYTDNQA